MIIKISLQAVLLLILLIGSGGAVNSSEQNQSEKLKKTKIYVSVPPLAYFAERIGGDNFEIFAVIGPGQSPATFETTPKQFTEFSKAEIFFSAGVPFEKHLNKKLKAAFKNLNIVDTQKGIELQHLEHRHHHGDTENETEEETNSLDPHTWLDPSLAKIMAQNIYDGLIKIYPTDSLVYRNNLNSLFEDLEKIDSFIKQELKPYAGRQFYIFHPAFGYFAKAYNLKQMAIEIEGKEPTVRQLTNIIEKAKKDRVEIIFTQPQFSDKSARAIAESVGARVIPIDPLSKDFLNNLKEITKQLVMAFKE